MTAATSTAAFTNWHGMSCTSLQALAAEHGTPFYLFDADVVTQRIERVRRAMQGQAQIYYAVKANPNRVLLEAVRAAADGLDISSDGELEQALGAGFEPARMSFAGPAKTAAELEAAIRAGVGAISVESVRELNACADIAGRVGMAAHILLRVNPLAPSRVFGLKMGGRPVQFGIDEETLPEVEAKVLRHGPLIDFRGIHVYAGSQGFDPAGLLEATRNTLRIARELEARTGLRCAKVNLGGGFGVSSAADQRELDVEAFGALMAPFLAEFHAGSSAPCELVFELGRYLTAEAGLYVTRVISAKASRGKLYFACDGGLHHHLAAAGTFGAAMRTNFAVVNLSQPDAPLVSCQLAGPSCNPTDLLGVDISLPEPREGSLLGVLRSGSYGMTASPILFLGHATPMELVSMGGQVVVGRRSFRMADFN